MHGAGGGFDGGEEPGEMARTLREAMMHIFVWMAIGLQLGFGGAADKPCIGPPSVFPRYVNCSRAEVDAVLLLGRDINYE